MNEGSGDRTHVWRWLHVVVGCSDCGGAGRVWV